MISYSRDGIRYDKSRYSRDRNRYDKLNCSRDRNRYDKLQSSTGQASEYRAGIESCDISQYNQVPDGHQSCDTVRGFVFKIAFKKSAGDLGPDLLTFTCMII